MKCPNCNGTGKEYSFYDGAESVWKDVICPTCNGTGEVGQTNEEWLRQCTTEQLADLMSRMVGCSNCPIPKDGRNCMGTYSGCWHEIIKWLKQPHHEKE